MEARTGRVLAVALALAVVGAGPSLGGPSDARRARVAVSYIVSHQRSDGAVEGGFSTIGSTADAVLSMVAARRSPRAIRKALDYLAAHVDEVEGKGLAAKVVMAAVAGGRDPRALGGRNLIRYIRSSQLPSGRYGEGTPVFDHALATLALRAARVDTNGAGTWLARAQCPDGGWQYDDPHGAGDNRHCYDGSAGDFFRTDTNSTSLAVQALAATGGRERLSHSPFEFFRVIRDRRKGGWGYDWTYRLTDANSTSLVLQAYAARDRRPPKGSMRALRALQYRLCGRRAGAFAFTWIESGDGSFERSGPDVGATISGVLGLLRRPLPIAFADVSRAAPQPVTC